jgi:UDP-N-acetylmuramoyl-tripeptide--D-alanyl-D-alanine ligase
MIPLSLVQIAGIVNGNLWDAPEPAALVTAPATVDSRKVTPGCLFAAIAGTRTDGHDYAVAAYADGAAVVLASRPVGVPAIVTEDVTVALGKIAQAMLRGITPEVVGLTGSVGKTTTKDLLAQILEPHAPTVATAGSFNNELGLPLTVLRATEHTRYLVLEMGVGRKGDIRYLTQLAPPRVGIVLNVAEAHLATLGGLDQVADAKSELVQALPPGGLGGVAVLNADDERVSAMADRTAARVVSYGRHQEATYRAVGITRRPDGAVSFVLVTPAGDRLISCQLPGEHLVTNYLAAAATAAELGVPLTGIAAALSTARPRSSGRMEFLSSPDGITILNDAYNANPASMRAALHTLGTLSASRSKVAILGEMTGLQDLSWDRHTEVGRLAASLDLGLLIVVDGPDQPGCGGAGPKALADAFAQVSPHTMVLTAEDKDVALALAADHIRPGDLVLVKGSSEVGLSGLAQALANG